MLTVAILHAITVGIYDKEELHDVSAKFTTKFNLKKLDFKNFLGSMLTYALNFAVCYTIILSYS